MVQLDDLIVLDTVTPDGAVLTYYGIVDQVTKRFEGNAFDTDAFHVADHSLPVEVSYAAHVQVTRLDPELFVPPHPGTPAQVVRGEAYQKALYFDRMERKVAIGLARTGEPIYANLEFLDGTGEHTLPSAAFPVLRRRLHTPLSCSIPSFTPNPSARMP
jgi:hypothetical protein